MRARRLNLRTRILATVADGRSVASVAQVARQERVQRSRAIRRLGWARKTGVWQPVGGMPTHELAQAGRDTHDRDP
jgi:hypothetical protein